PAAALAGRVVAHPRPRGWNVEDRALVERSHEFAAEASRYRNGSGDDRQRYQNDSGAVAEREATDRRVDRGEGARKRVLVLVADAAADEERRHRRHQRDREERGERHREGLSEGERAEEAPLGSLEREDRQERDGDDEEREEDRPADLGEGGPDHGGARLGAALALPTLQALVDVLDDDDGG